MNLYRKKYEQYLALREKFNGGGLTLDDYVFIIATISFAIFNIFMAKINLNSANISNEDLNKAIYRIAMSLFAIIGLSCYYIFSIPPDDESKYTEFTENDTIALFDYIFLVGLITAVWNIYMAKRDVDLRKNSQKAALKLMLSVIAIVSLFVYIITFRTETMIYKIFYSKESYEESRRNQKKMIVDHLLSGF